MHVQYLIGEKDVASHDSNSNRDLDSLSSNKVLHCNAKYSNQTAHLGNGERILKSTESKIQIRTKSTVMEFKRIFNFDKEAIKPSQEDLKLFPFHFSSV